MTFPQCMLIKIQRSTSVSLLIRTTNSILRPLLLWTHLNLNYVSKAPSPNTMTLGVIAQFGLLACKNTCITSQRTQTPNLFQQKLYSLKSSLIKIRKRWDRRQNPEAEFLFNCNMWNYTKFCVVGSCTLQSPGTLMASFSLLKPDQWSWWFLNQLQRNSSFLKNYTSL